MEHTQTYFANQKTVEAGKAVLAAFEEETKNAMETNAALLMKILQDNKDTEYGKKYNFAEIKSVEEYQKKVPVVVYENIDESIERMKNGEKNILTVYEFDHLNETSGTVGKQKCVPLTKEQTQVFMKYNYLYNEGLKAKYLDPSYLEGRTFCNSEGNFRTLPSGITVGCASSKMADFIQGGKDAFDKMIRTLFTSPLEATAPGLGTNTKYIHVRFALMDKFVTGITTGFFGTLTHLFYYINDNINLLIDDIEKGTISSEIEMPDSSRESLLKKIQPMPERAAELREIFKDGTDFRWVKKVWPNFQFIYGVGGDGFSVYTELIKEKFVTEDVNFFFSGVTASEGLWSVPAGVNDLDSVIAPGSAFIEFLPVEAENDFSQAVTLDKVQEGKIYELIITNLCGFYRYRMSDALLVTGFKNKSPKVQFMYRVNKTINLACEKTTELALKVTCENVAKELGFALDDFTVYANTSVNPGRYDFMIETHDEKRFSISRETLEECVLKHLKEANHEFRECWEEHLIQSPKADFLQPETQMLWRDIQVYKGASFSQLKPVHVISNEAQRKFFTGLIEK